MEEAKSSPAIIATKANITRSLVIVSRNCTKRFSFLSRKEEVCYIEEQTKNMDIYFSDETSIRLKGKKTALVIDPTSTVEADAILLTQKNLSYVKLDKVKNARVTIAGSGEYEIGGVAIVGVKVGETTTYYVKMDGVALVHLGGITAPLSDSEIDKYPSVDVLFVPVIKGIAEMVTKFEAK